MKQFKRMILASTLMVGLAGFAVSCKYGDDIDEIRKDIESLRTGQVASVESQLSSLQATVSSLSSAKDALQSTVSGLESQLNDLKGSVATAKDVAAVEAKIADLEKEIAALKSADAVLEEKITKINETLKDFVTNDQLAATLKSYATVNEVSDAIAAVTKALGKFTTEESIQKAIDAAQAAAVKAAGEAFEAAFQGKFDAAVEAAKLVNADALQDEIDAYDAKIKEFITKAIEENNGTVTEAVAKQVSEELAKFKTAVDEILSTVVTSVELVYSYAAQNSEEAFGAWNLTFSTVEEQDNVFGTKKDGFEINDPIEFKKGNQIQTPASFVVRVSPVNAQLTPEMISFVNSKGETLDIVTVKSVEPFEELLTRAAGNNGLWTVEAELENYEEKAFESATKVVDKDKIKHSILFAVQVNNTKDYAERYVTSTYDLSFDWEPFTPANELSFKVDNTPVADINNRYVGKVGNSLVQKDAKITYEELAWAASTDKYPTPAVEIAYKNNVPQNAVLDTKDDRSEKEVYPAVQGVPMTISLGKEYEEKVRAIYVTLDYKEHAVESAPSEWNAWKDYTIEGLNTVVKGTSIDINFTDKTAIRDIVGLRVFAVNYDGTLVDPDGKAFYVSLGLEGENWNAVKTVVTPTKQLTGTDDETSAKKDLAIKTEVNGKEISEFTWVTKAVVRNVKWNNGTDGKYVEDDGTYTTEVYYGDDKGEDKLFHVAFYDAKNTLLFVTDGSKGTNVDFSKVAYIKTFVNPNVIRKNNKYGVTWASFEDGKEYVGTLTLKDDTGHVLATLNVSMTKELPDVPAGFSIKTNQGPDQGKPWNAFLIPTVNENDDPKTAASWAATTANYGTMDLADLVNFGEGDVENYVFTFAASKYAANGKDLDVKEVKSAAPGENPILSVAAEFIDNKTSHATKVGYNFGYISSVTIKKDSNELKPWIATAAEFETLYFDIYNNDTNLGYTWAWTAATAKGTSVTYGDMTNGYDVPLASIKGTSKKDSRYNVAKLDTYGYGKSVKIVDAHLYTKARYDKGELIEEYYKFDGNTNATTLHFECISDDTNVTGDVTCILVIDYVDMYGDEAVDSDKDPDGVHVHQIPLNVTIKKR